MLDIAVVMLNLEEVVIFLHKEPANKSSFTSFEAIVNTVYYIGHTYMSKGKHRKHTNVYLKYMPYTSS